MAGLFDFTKYDKDDPGADVDEQTALELRRIANLFLLSAVTLVLLMLLMFAQALSVTFITGMVKAILGGIMLVGWAMTLVYGVYVTYAARRWVWLVLCAIPFTCVPAAVVYAWTRRQEIERAVLGEQRAPAARQRRGGKKR